MHSAWSWRGDRSVAVRVGVAEPGGDHQTAAVDAFGHSSAEELAHCHDPVAPQGNISNTWWCASAVNDGSPFKQRINLDGGRLFALVRRPGVCPRTWHCTCRCS